MYDLYIITRIRSRERDRWYEQKSSRWDLKNSEMTSTQVRMRLIWLSSIAFPL